MIQQALAPKVVGIFTCPAAGAPMQSRESVEAVAGRGPRGDRYFEGEGSFSTGKPQRNRQVTLINGLFFRGNVFTYAESRRNIITMDVELMWLIGRRFQVGEAFFLGLKYCDPCNRPSKLSGKGRSFQEVFFDLGGLVAAVIESGEICLEDPIVPPDKGY